MGFDQIYTQLGILFLTILVGFILGKIKIMTPDVTQVFSKYVLKVAIPALVVSSMMITFTPEKLHTAVWIIILSIPCYGIAYLVGVLAARALAKEAGARAVYCFGLVFSNSGFIAFPVFLALYGKESIFYAAIYNIMYFLLLYTLGIKIMRTGKQRIKGKFAFKVLVNPGVVASIVGLALFISAIRLPTVIQGTIESIGSTCVPLSMLIIGAILSEAPVKNVFTQLNIYCLALVRVILLPILTLVLLKYVFGIENMWLIVIPVITAGMPVGMNIAMMAKEYDNDSALASQTILITTLFSCLTIPLLAELLQYIL